MDLKGKRIVLASGSPRRRELLAGLDVEFTVDTRTNFKESLDPTLPHEMIPVMMARGKSDGFWRELEQDEILITADTLVLCGRDVLGKPHSRDEAVRMLKELSGNRHSVITAVVIRSLQRYECFTDRSEVWFGNLSDNEIDYYIDKYRPYDKAGAYGVQEWIGYVGIEKIEGSFYNVMGLPVHKLYRELLSFIG